MNEYIYYSKNEILSNEFQHKDISYEQKYIHFNIEQINGIELREEQKVHYFDNPSHTHLEVQGWSFIEKEENNSSRVLILFDEYKINHIETFFIHNNVERRDVKEIHTIAPEQAGFFENIELKNLFHQRDGKYRLCLAHRLGNIIAGDISKWVITIKDRAIYKVEESLQDTQSVQNRFKRFLRLRANQFWQPLWQIFDEKWYVRQYPNVESEIKPDGISVWEYYCAKGKKLGHSPNIYFDEEWYIRQYPHVKESIENGVYASGFDHYRESGSRDGFSPLWMFSENYYKEKYCISNHILFGQFYYNGYDLFLTIGDRIKHNPHYLFDAASISRQLGVLDENYASHSPFKYILNHSEILRKIKASDYFDSEWYCTRYPEVVSQIEQGLYISSLHHYLTSKDSLQFNPHQWFSEEEYRKVNTDLVSVVDNGVYRNSYEHFVRYGAAELRKISENFDLAVLNDRSILLQNMIFFESYENVFQAFLHALSEAEVRCEKTIDNISTEECVSFLESDSKLVSKNASYASLPLSGRHFLDFSYEAKPVLTLIIYAKDSISLFQTLASARENTSKTMQLILIDVNASAQLAAFDDLVQHALIVSVTSEQDVLSAYNLAIEKAEADYILFLNDAALLQPFAIDQGLLRLISSPSIGAVGGKIINEKGVLEEAGGIIWRNGEVEAYFNGNNPNVIEVNFVRNVDYCSKHFLMTRTALLRENGGFDTSYSVNSYEDIHFCVQLNNSGYQVAYDPGIRLEISKGNRSYLEHDRDHFISEHAVYLRGKYPAHKNNIKAASVTKPHKARILYFEDRLPVKNMGAGYIRSNDIITSMVELGYEVSIFPTTHFVKNDRKIYQSFPDTVELLLHYDVQNLENFLVETAGLFDLVWIGRTHNLDIMIPILNKMSRFLPDNGIILDTEAVASTREIMFQNIYKNNEYSANEGIGALIPEKDLLQKNLSKEFKFVSNCRKIITVNQQDSLFLREIGYYNTEILGHMVQAKPTPNSFNDRHNILFLGALHDYFSPNYDSMIWFLEDIFPRLNALMGDNICRLTIAGYVAPAINLDELKSYENVDVIGPVTNLEELFNRHRVFVAPTRFAGGIPYKVHEAASYGLPIVSTDILAKQVGWQDGEELMTAPIDDAEIFVQKIHQLYTEENVWINLRKKALLKIEDECSPVLFKKKLDSILQSILGN